MMYYSKPYHQPYDVLFKTLPTNLRMNYSNLTTKPYDVLFKTLPPNLMMYYSKPYHQTL